MATDRPVRFEIALTTARREELGQMAHETGISMADLTRLALTRLLSQRGEILHGNLGRAA